MSVLDKLAHDWTADAADAGAGCGRCPAWYAVGVKSLHEKAVAAGLRLKGYEVLLPTYSSMRYWSDRRKRIESPLFSGYVFCRFDVRDRLPILAVPAVSSIVGIGKAPAPLSCREVEALTALTASGVAAEPWPYVRVGQTVRVKQGPLRGAEGIVVRIKNQCRLILSVALLQRSVAVEVNEAWVVPASDVSTPNSFVRAVSPN